jgi:ubiquinone/menaquinone biosynthesis C-methylase UbiE
LPGFPETPAVTNPFVYSAAAQRYAQARPYHQDIVVKRICEAINPSRFFTAALDVGCGTGQSCLALRALARRVIGLDSALEMLAHAPRENGISYVWGTAEALPAASGALELLTVSSAFHWFDRERFFAEVRRVLSPGGWFVVYNNGFKGIMAGNREFARWFHETYPRRYPAPDRNRTPITETEAERAGFALVHSEVYSNDVVFTPEALARYLTTQSNLIVAVEGGHEAYDAAYEWVLDGVRPYFPDSEATFAFGGPIWCLQRQE